MLPAGLFDWSPWNAGGRDYAMRIYDITLPIQTGMMVWPGDPPVEVTPRLSIEAGDAVNVSSISMGTHSGTHVDAPSHFCPGCGTMDQLDLAMLVGPAIVVAFAAGTGISADDLKAADIPADTLRLLVKARDTTAKESGRGPSLSDGVYLMPDAARWLVERGIRLVGVESLSIGGGAEKDGATHKTLLEAGVIIVEGVDLSAVAPGVYDLCCLPLRIADGDGGPARAILTG